MRGLAGEEPLVYKELILETIKPSELTLVDLTWSKERKAAGEYTTRNSSYNGL